LAPDIVMFPPGHGRLEVLVMPKQHGQCYFAILAVGFMAALTLRTDAAFGSEMRATVPAPVIESVDGAHNRGLQLQPLETADARPLANGTGPPETDLMLVTRQSCNTSLGDTPLSAIPVLGGGDRRGEWVLLAGVGWDKKRGFGAMGPVMIETPEGREPAYWFFTVEMLFIPEGRWNVRASLAIDGEDLHDAMTATDTQLNPLRIGVAIAFDHGGKSPLVLDLGYGRLPLEGRILSVSPDGGQPDHVLSETRVFSACLNIQF
jgi:hypothetical protein